MAQPLAIYASIPASTGANWLIDSGNIAPVTITTPYPHWPNVDWSDGNIAPSSGYGEIPQYLWSIPDPDPQDNDPKTFTRRLTVSPVITLPNITQFPTRTGRFRFVFSIAVDDEYTFRLLINEKPIPGEEPSEGFNLLVPIADSWRNVKTYSFGAGEKPVMLTDGDTLDIQTMVTNLPQPAGYNPAMVTWVLQMFVAE
ncbi:MAG TPA: hypothetical protein VHY08_20135 [Bacillota bacterium]|nr:hypothetical protein [Bacillota bacterium]